MREIKFRAWDIENETIISDIQTCYDSNLGPAYGNCSFGDFLNDERWIVEQFTGLKDKNGREIYEGDILGARLPSGILACGEMTWNEKGARWSQFSPLKDFAILGNIHENKVSDFY
jgi:hypothetical protein